MYCEDNEGLKMRTVDSVLWEQWRLQMRTVDSVL